jgi:hypothetical protein
VKPFEPLEPKTDEQLELVARQSRYVRTLLKDALSDDDVTSFVALLEIQHVLRVGPDGEVPPDA